MLFNMLIAFVFCFIVALIAMNPRATKAGDVPAKAEYIITLSWPDNDPNDLDAWVQGPGGDVVWFRNREAGLLHLDRDDRGLSNDTLVVNGRRVVNPINQEVVTLRGIAPGEYVVNAHYYDGSTAIRSEPGFGPCRAGHGVGGEGESARRGGVPCHADAGGAGHRADLPALHRAGRRQRHRHQHHRPGAGEKI